MTNSTSWLSTARAGTSQSCFDNTKNSSKSTTTQLSSSSNYYEADIISLRLSLWTGTSSPRSQTIQPPRQRRENQTRRFRVRSTDHQLYRIVCLQCRLAVLHAARKFEEKSVYLWVWCVGSGSDRVRAILWLVAVSVEGGQPAVLKNNE